MMLVEKLYLDAVKFRGSNISCFENPSSQILEFLMYAKEGWPPYSVLQEVPLRLVSSPPQSYRCAPPGCDFCISTELFVKSEH